MTAPRLRNNIRRELVLDEGDAVAQMQLALLQALDLELVEARRVLQCSNGGVEVAMLLLQSRQLLLQLTLFLFGHQLPEIAKLACGREKYRFLPLFVQVGRARGS